MATLNNVEGKAHVEVDDGNMRWHGYILVPPTPKNVFYFQVMPWSIMEAVYEGPVLFKGNFHFGRGIAQIQMVQDTEQEVRVDFSSEVEFHIEGSLEEQPSDFMSE